MDWLKKYSERKQRGGGFEWWLWKKLPILTLLGAAIPLVALALLHWRYSGDTSEATLRMLQMAQFTFWGVLLFHATMILTIAIGCVVVMIMKGPGYVADGYWVSHSDRPRRDMETTEEAAARRHVP